MSERRCPSCGGLVGADATWCGQCFARLDESPEEGAGMLSSGTDVSPEAVAPGPTGPGGPRSEGSPDAPAEPGAAPTEGSGIRVEGDRVVWRCPRCSTENPIEASACSACGAAFGQLFDGEEERPRVSAGRAIRLSLLFPGMGHAATGRRAEGLARAVVFGYAAATVVAILVMRAGSGLGPFMALFMLCLGAAVAFYALAAIDAGRAATGEPPILSSRGLLYGAAGLVLVTVVVLVITGIRASRGA